MNDRDVAVVGLGYAGLVLAAALAEAGFRVIGVDVNAAVRAAVRAKRPPFAERGLAELLERHVGRGLTVGVRVPAGIAAAIICVSTPVDPETRRPALDMLVRATEHVREQMSPDTLVIVRSTVPVGTTTGLVARILAQAVSAPLVAFCPERTIQGKALEELRKLPQVLGASSQTAADRAAALFSRIASEVVQVSSPSAAEAVKLINNAHTDVIYGFGNEVALLAERLGLDAGELIGAANHNYPRPELCGPGFVGGSCLTKDPFLLLHSVGGRATDFPLIAAARKRNESLPLLVWNRVERAARDHGIAPSRATVMLAGVAYKGEPQTDDTRGSAAVALAEAIRGRIGRLLMQDFEVGKERLRSLGGQPVSLLDGLRRANIILLLNNHPGYRETQPARAFASTRRKRLVWDAWGLWESSRGSWPSVIRYMRLGRA